MATLAETLQHRQLLELAHPWRLTELGAGLVCFSGPWKGLEARGGPGSLLSQLSSSRRQSAGMGVPEADRGVSGNSLWTVPVPLVLRGA